MESELSYPGQAEAAQAIDDTIRSGILPDNYFIDPLITPFQIKVIGSDGNAIAHDPVSYPDIQLAKQAADKIREHLYRFYSIEGFYVVEHMLLYPVSPVGNHLLINDSINPCQPVQVPRTDPYSFQLTFVFPSGFARDFNLPPPVVRTESQPDRFRDAEFRTYAERTIRKACPAHILPVLIWVDRALPGTAIPVNAPCFDVFENAYREWLAAFFTDEVPETTISPLRNVLVTIMNSLFADIP